LLVTDPSDDRPRTTSPPVFPAHASRRPLRSLRPAVAAAVVLAATALVLVSAGPAAALRDDGEQSGSGLSVAQTLLIFVGIPLAVIVVVWILVSAPAKARGPRYRPGLGWWAAPVWFNGPANADAAVRSAVPTPIKEGGGASARW
jgi:hypothetical protein